MKKILGLDLGVSSLGWAIIETDENEENIQLLPGAIGVRIFSQVTKVDNDKEMKNAARRTSRGMRRNIARRVRRVAHVLQILIEKGLLPKVTLSKEKNISLQEEYWNHPDVQGLLKVNPLELRAKGVNEKLELYEFGRALYHICQKRGFQSTSKKELKELGLLESPENDTSTKKEKKLTPFKQKIKDLEDQFENKTLGQYLYSLIEDENNPQTIRNLGTNRDMYRHEFDVLWTEQSKYHPELTDAVKKILKDIIFTQRPLKSQEDKVGFCKYFPEKRKISKSHPLAQEFIILGYLNNLTVFRDAQKRDTLNIAEIFGENLEKKLGEGLEIFRTVQEIKKKRICEWLGIDEKLLNSNKASWNGDTLHIKLSKILDKYAEWNTDKQYHLIQALKDEDITRTHKSYTELGIDEKYWLELDNIAEKDIPSKYLELSQKAIEIFLPELRKGVPFKTIEKNLKEKGILPKENHNKYSTIGLSRKPGNTHNHLPDIANPRVTKALVELRKVLRGITTKYGAIDEIRIETSRDLKNGPDKRAKIEKNQREREKENDAIKKELTENFPGRNTDIHSDDFKKYKLWKELGINHESPYHTKGHSTENIMISSSDLFDNAKIQIEHILPLSWSLDDSFNNKTLCPHDINLDKGNKTPFEYYNGPDSADWKAFETRVKRIFGGVKDGKEWLRRKGRQLLLTPDEVRELQGKFATQDLNDTAYIAIEAKEFCQALLGEAKHEQSLVQTSKGQLTSVLRWNWRWNELLNPDETNLELKNVKNRGDHRHHAIDAVIIALTCRKIMKRASDLAKKLDEDKREIKLHERVWGNIVPGIDGITLTLQKNLEEMNVSHAYNKKTSGALHKETNYGTRELQVGSTKNKVVTTRISIDILADTIKKLPQGDDRASKAHDLVGNIMDRLIREDIFGKIIDNTFALPYLHPVTKTPIKKIRKIDESLTVDGLMPFGKGLFKNDDNHHIEILEFTTEGKNKGKKVGVVVQLSEAYERKKNHEPICNRTGPWEDKKDGKIYTSSEYKFLFSLTKGELVQREEDKKIYQYTSVNNQKVMTFYEQYSSEKGNKNARIQPVPNTLKAQKIQIDALGDIRLAND